MPGPWFSLEQFKAELRTGNYHVYRGRALEPISRLLRCGPRQAREFASRAALALEEADYAHTLMMPNGQIQDVYGRVIDMDGWYLKIEIHMDDGQPGIVSCHPAEHDLITLGGLIPGPQRSE